MGVSASPRLRIALVAPSLTILGGQAVQADRLLAAWRDDPEVDAWLVPVNPLPPPFLRPALGIKYARTVVTQLAYWPLLLRELRRADVVHVFSASYFSFLLAPLPAILMARLLGKPVLLNYRSGEAPDHLSRSAVARFALSRVGRNVVPSGFLRDVFASFGIDAAVIQNIVDVERFRFRRRVPLQPRLVSTRNFDRLYNVACTVRAFRIVQDHYPDAALTLVGDGAERRNLERLVRDLGLRNVTFTGRVDPGEIWRCYDEADIYVQTPDIDNMPASVLEAYASGLPVVSTNAGGIPYIVEHEREGLLTAVGDHRGIGEAIVRLLDDPALAARVIEGGRQHVSRCTWQQVRHQWLAMYRHLSALPAVHARAAESLR
jgi:glycosyltransferase involved in cell wall biosynthesis